MVIVAAPVELTHPMGYMGGGRYSDGPSGALQTRARPDKLSSGLQEP